MRRLATRNDHPGHWAAPRVIEPAEGAFFTRVAAPAIVDRAFPASHRRAIIRLLRVGLGLNVALWTGLMVQFARIF
ncbi:MAG: hypothetical protein PGN09_02235 [Sphingomonas fennica]